MKAPQMKRTALKLCLLVLGVASATACSSTTLERTGQGEALVTSAADRVAYDFFVAKGLTKFQSAGIVGNLDQESQMNPGAVQPGGPGRGIAQWSAGGRWDADGNDNAVWYAATRGQSVGTLNLQLEFIWYELQTFPAFGLAQLRQTTNLRDAVLVFEDKFEQCGG